MGQLVQFELSKLLKKKLVFITLALFGGIMVVMLFSWVSGNEWAKLPDGSILLGQEASDYNTELTLRYQGLLTDEKVQGILQEFSDNGNSQYNIINRVYSPVAKMFAEENGAWNGKTVSEAFPEFEEPPVLGFSSRWEALLNSMTYLVLLAGLVLIIVISPVFSEEYMSGMDALILTSEKGPRQCVKAKVIASFLFSLCLVSIILILGFAMLFLENGFVGWNSDIQLSELCLFLGVKTPLKCYQAAWLMVCASILSTLTINGLVLIFSAASRTSFNSVVVAAAVYVVPIFFNPGSLELKRLVAVMPANSMNVALFMKTGGYRMLGAIFALAAAVTLLSIDYCHRTFSGHQVVSKS